MHGCHPCDTRTENSRAHGGFESSPGRQSSNHQMQDRGYDAHVQTGETEDSNSENHVHCPNYWRYMRAIALPSAWILQEVKALWTDPLLVGVLCQDSYCLRG